MTQTIFSLSGFAGSGKDTAADYFVNVHKFRRIAFADTLKDVLSVLFNWPRNLLEGRSTESREWRETVDEWWSNKLDIPDFTPRWAMRNIGTEVFREHFHTNIWLYSLENKIKSSNDNIIITDARFLNELDLIKSMNGQTIKINRNRPQWLSSAEWYFKYGYNDHSLRFLLEQSAHPSEWEWLPHQFDLEIDNTKDIHHLYTQLEQIIK